MYNTNDQQQSGPTPGLVLIVDDEAPIAEALAMIIEDAGFTPLIAKHGQQAIELARAQPPALVITDLMMPRLDGTALIAALRADAAANDHAVPPMVLVTAGGLQQANAAGADAVLLKPFTVEEVEALLRRFLSPPSDPPA